MRRFVFALLWIAIGLGAVEATAWALLRARPVLGERAALAARGEDPGERGRAATRIGHRFRGGFWEEVVHPFLGFVVVPPATVAPGTLRALGLPFAGEQPLVAGPDTVTVGLFGGSVAAYFADSGGIERVAQQLADLAPFAGKRVTPIVGAHIGYKQPQQLATLAWLQAHGVRFDVVLLLDGFNEVVAAPFELVPNGVYPFFPGHWHQRVAAFEASVAMQERIGEIAFRKRRRADAAAAFLGSPLRHSHLAELGWALFDLREERALEAARARSDPAEASAARAYAASGPAPPTRDPEALADELARFWAESSRQMRALTEARGGRFFHLLQPNQHFAGSKPIGPDEHEVAVRGGEVFAEHIGRGYPRLQQQGRALVAEGTRFHDLTGAFRDVEEPLYVDNIGHLGRRGNELLADAIAAALRADLEAERQGR